LAIRERDPSEIWNSFRKIGSENKQRRSERAFLFHVVENARIHLDESPIATNVGEMSGTIAELLIARFTLTPPTSRSPQPRSGGLKTQYRQDPIAIRLESSILATGELPEEENRQKLLGQDCPRSRKHRAHVLQPSYLPAGYAGP